MKIHALTSPAARRVLGGSFVAACVLAAVAQQPAPKPAPTLETFAPAPAAEGAPAAVPAPTPAPAAISVLPGAGVAATTTEVRIESKPEPAVAGASGVATIELGAGGPPAKLSHRIVRAKAGPTPAAENGFPGFNSVRFGGGASVSGAAGLARAVVDDDLQANPEEAARHYEAVIAEFDSERVTAAQAIFRLAEAYRKLGRLDESRVQYARILREFVDFPELSRLSQMQLAQSPSRGGGRIAQPEFAPAREGGGNPSIAAEERQLLDQEIALLHTQLEQTQQLIKTGNASESAVIPIQREILQLKRQRLHRELDAPREPREPATPAPVALPAPPAPPTAAAPALPAGAGAGSPDSPPVAPHGELPAAPAPPAAGSPPVRIRLNNLPVDPSLGVPGGLAPPEKK